MKKIINYLVVFLLFAGAFAAMGETAESRVGEQTSQTTKSASPSEAALAVGDRVQVHWKDGKNYRAVIIEVRDGAYKVHYDGYAASLDEVVAAGNVEPTAKSSVAPKSKAWQLNDKVSAERSGGGKFYDGMIVEINAGRYKIHYTEDADNSGDEWRETAQLKPFDAWTWTNAAGRVQSSQQLKNIIERHAQWLAADGKAGAQANLAGASLNDANLLMANLKLANLEGITLIGSNLKLADLTGANLKNAHFISCQLDSTHLDSAELMKAVLVGTDLSKSYMEKANLTGASVIGSKLNDAFLIDANFSGAAIINTDLTGAAFDRVDFKDAVYEPKKNPEIRYIASALNLETLKYQNLPDALVQLRQSFKVSGFGSQENKITYALKRMENRLLWEDAFSITCNSGGESDAACVNAVGRGRECTADACAGEPQNIIYYYLNLIFFDWTVRYGMRPERALVILFFLWLICAVIYDLFIHYPGKDGIYLLKTRKYREPVRTRGLRIVPHRLDKKLRPRHRRWWQWWRREWRIFRLGMFFSLMTTFNIGFKEFDIGRWLGMLTKREYELIPRHWTRTVAGFQSLLSLYLIAMWILTHFGQPFE